LTRNVQFRTERDVRIIVAFDESRELAGGFHRWIVRPAAIHRTVTFPPVE
jgi:hypothetical protein